MYLHPIRQFRHLCQNDNPAEDDSSTTTTTTTTDHGDDCDEGEQDDPIESRIDEHRKALHHLDHTPLICSTSANSSNGINLNWDEDGDHPSIPCI